MGPEGRKRSVVVCATSERPAPLRVRACFVALAVAEYFRDQGANVLLVMDSVTRLAMAQREIGLAAGEPPSQKGYTPSVFNLLPKILERAGNFRRGSITGFFTVLVEGDDFNEPICDAVRGILDGHFILSRQLAGQGHYPAIDILHSVSRLASAISTPPQKDAARKIRQALAAYKDSEDLMQLGAYVAGLEPAARCQHPAASRASRFPPPGPYGHLSHAGDPGPHAGAVDAARTRRAAAGGRQAMTSFHFRLEKVLEWRRIELEQEEARFRSQSDALAAIDRRRAELEAGGIRAEVQVREWNPLAGNDLTALSAYRAHVRRSESRLSAERQACQARAGRAQGRAARGPAAVPPARTAERAPARGMARRGRPRAAGTGLRIVPGAVEPRALRAAAYWSCSARTLFSTGSSSAISTPRGAVFNSANLRALTITRLSNDPTAPL